MSSIAPTGTSSSMAAPLPVNRVSLSISSLTSLLLFLYLFSLYGWKHAALFLVGAAAGLILYHSAFGFTAAWRDAAIAGRGAGLRAQMLMLAVTVLIFTPLIAQGEILGTSLRGFEAPVNLAVLCGAFMFGVGMQLGGGCASGTLFTAGGGNVRMLITLAAFIIGALIGSWQWPLWQDVPGFAPVSLSRSLGVSGAVAVSLLMFSLVWFASAWLERRRHGVVGGLNYGPSRSLLRGPWPLLWGALALAAVNSATLLLAGRPWGVTGAFSLWGAKIAGLAGLDVAGWAFWQRQGAAEALEKSVLQDVTSVMNFGIMLGALTAASLASKFSPEWRLPWKSAAAAVVGGLLLGYGARIAFGCNIGAYFSGISSTSLHGWLWFAAAFAGSFLGSRLRPWFGLA
jgi:uncharacterized membrane protein YedE/YeeE